MIAVVQRVRRSAVYTDGEKISEISQGLLTLLGIEQGDQESDLQILISKILELRIFQDEQDKMNLSLKDVGGEHLIVSQFTLAADVKKGRRPSFVQAERPERAEPLYELAMRLSSDQGVPTKGGKFGADMRVEIENDGPVTILIQVQKGQFL